MHLAQAVVEAALISSLYHSRTRRKMTVRGEGGAICNKEHNQGYGFMKQLCVREAVQRNEVEAA
jgi:hypothetical protein